MPIVVRDCSGMSTGEISAKVREIGKPVLLKFSSEGCAPCEDLKEKLGQYQTDLEVNVLELRRTRTSSYADLWDKFDITAFPTIVLVDKDLEEIRSTDEINGKTLSRIIGSNIKKFEELINGHRNLFKQGCSQ
ncbi:thioredoxin [Encephalitozoon intestinalis ATCC 50506]|uniref:Thioredoxin n=1 Tax=Encephalitozoon intestinalis (strain ATCC 50506) TaxID=876142 RepID=E0S5G0_ENCIT|nr:thioredoxin [Encephalitozoon intestinalis ATCC 50506]ADM10945.2 thioredoxin [Encephalitozoon intestinalis ATCC 50506]UTX44580.1 thioredoxin [Encephalitozoon intestinalis]